jgi:putative transposase
MTEKTKIKYHVILVTKYRRNCLRDDIMGTCIELITTRLEQMRCNLIAIRGDTSNHIHIMFEAKPAQSVSLIVQILKQLTTYHIWRNMDFAVYLREYYWHKNYLWSSGYFCSTTGNASSAIIEEYINSQGN